MCANKGPDVTAAELKRDLCQTASQWRPGSVRTPDLVIVVPLARNSAVYVCTLLAVVRMSTSSGF